MFLLSGHDLERWLLKTMKAMAEAKSLSRDRQRLSGAFASGVALIDMLADPTAWPPGAGLYCFMRPGDVTTAGPEFQMQPYTNLDGSIVGAAVNILGIYFTVMFEPPDEERHPVFRSARYRPSERSISFPSRRHRIILSLEDALQTHNPLSLAFRQSCPQGPCVISVCGLCVWQQNPQPKLIIH